MRRSEAWLTNDSGDQNPWCCGTSSFKVCLLLRAQDILKEALFLRRFDWAGSGTGQVLTNDITLLRMASSSIWIVIMDAR